MAIHMKILINKVENIIHNNDIKLKLFEIIIHAPHTKQYIHIYIYIYSKTKIFQIIYRLWMYIFFYL
jgi:hypothetical protein